MTPQDKLRHYVTGAIERGEKTAIVERRIGTCPHCGSVLSAVTWECVRGKHCPGAR